MAPFKMYMNGCITVQQIYMKFGVATETNSGCFILLLRH